MTNIIQFDRIRISSLKRNTVAILPAREDTTPELVVDHAADPIKSLDDIRRIADHLISNRRWRDYMLFIVGINFGLRASDLLSLRFSDLINDDFSFKTTFPVFEKKTRNTRTVKKNRYITVNEAVMDAVELYLANCGKQCCLSDYMFRSESNRCTENKPLQVYSLERILKKIGTELSIDAHLSTHTLRKTFGYHQMMMSNNDPRKLLLLQRIFGHSSTTQTLTYIGITEDEISNAYLDLNLGGQDYSLFSTLTA